MASSTTSKVIASNRVILSQLSKSIISTFSSSSLTSSYTVATATRALSSSSLCRLLNNNDNNNKIINNSTPQRSATSIRSIVTCTPILQNEASTEPQPALVEAAAAAVEAAPPAPFSSPQLEKLFTKITSLPQEEIGLIGDVMAEKCGITLTPYDLGLISPSSTSEQEEEEDQKEEEKSTFDLKLTSFDPKTKIKVIKEVRSQLNLGLKEAKELVDNVPKVLKKDMKKEDAEVLKGVLEGVGGIVEIL